MAKHIPEDGSLGNQEKRFSFKESSRKTIQAIRSGQGPATTRLAAGDFSASTKREAAEETVAQLGGRLPRSQFKAARAGKLVEPIKRRKRLKK